MRSSMVEVRDVFARGKEQRVSAARGRRQGARRSGCAVENGASAQLEERGNLFELGARCGLSLFEWLVK